MSLRKPSFPRVYRHTGAPTLWAPLDSQRRTFAADTGDAYDLAGNTPAGVRGGGCAWANGANGACLSFDAATGHLDFAGASVPSEFTIVVGFTVTSIPGTGTLLVSANNANVQIRWSVTGLLGVTADGSHILNSATSYVVPTGVPIEVAFTVKGTVWTIYVNGNLDTQSTQFAVSAGTGIRLGAWQSNSYYFGGTIDYFRLYNYAQTPTQVAREAQRPWARCHPPTPMPVADWCSATTIVYHVYANTGAGDPVNYGSIVATTDALTYTTAALTYPGTWRFGVRAYDTVSAIEETNAVQATLVLNAAGVNITSQPNPPVNLTVFPTAGGGATVVWSYNPGGQGGAPTGFHVYQGTPTVSYASAVRTVPYAVGRLTFSCTLSGLTSGSTYQVGVRSYNALVEPNTTVVTFIAAGTGPTPVLSLTVTAVP